MRHGYIASNSSSSTSTVSCPVTTCRSATSALRQPCGAPRVLASRLQQLYINYVVRREYSSPGCIGSTSTTPSVWVPRLLARLVIDYFAHAARPDASTHHAARRAARCRLLRHVAWLVAWLAVDYFALRRLVARLVVDCFAYATRPGASARRAARLMARRRLLRLRRATGCHGTSRGSSRGSSSTIHLAQARRRLFRPCRASGCLGTSRGSSHGSSRGSSSTTAPRAGSSSTTSPTPRVWVPRLVARLIVDYFVHAAHPGASACRAARRMARCAVHVEYFTSVVRSGASAPRAARRRLLLLRRTSGCLGSSRGSSSTTSPTPRVRVPRLVGWLIVDLAPSRRSTSRRSVALAPTVCPVTPSHGSATRRPAALALLHLCRASERAVSPLYFSSVGCIGSRRAPDRSFSRLDYSVPPLDLLSGRTGSTSATPCITTTCLAATLAVLRVRHVPPRHSPPVASRRPLILTSFPN
jgi:hypothetical protein